MSLFYLSVRNISKSTQSAVASAAYRSGESLYSERDLEQKSYGEREVKPDSFILAPEHAPEWVYNREKLWNEVELAERNWNARVAKEVLVALPIELTNEQQKVMLKEYVNENFVDDGMVADVSIHRDRNENPHAHIMLTVRPFNLDGTWGNKKKREYILNENGENVLDKNGDKKFKTIRLTDWDREESLLNWRKNFAEKVNEHYIKHDINESISHESYEDQGIDKLPKQRLTRSEYKFEQNRKEKAEKAGKDYKPKVRYARLNQEIEKVNRKLEVLKDKVVSLMDYKKTISNEKMNDLESIRKNHSISSEDWKSIKVVSSRVKGFVDYKNAKDNLSKLANWKKSLEYQERQIKSEEKVLIKSKLLYESEPNKTLLYGFVPSKFKEEFTFKLNEFNDKKLKHEESLKAYSQLENHSNKAFEIQKEFVNEEFAFLYPDYSTKVDFHNDSTYEIKNKYIQLFKNERTIRKSIPEFDKNLELLTNDSLKTKALVAEWKSVNDSLLILERTKNKRKNEYATSYKSGELKKTYSDSIKYTEVREQITEKEIQKAVLQEKITQEIIKKYPDIKLDTIKNVPSEIKSKVLELHVKGMNSGSLSEDLKMVRDNENNNKGKSSINITEGGGKEVGKDIGSLLGSLISMAQNNEQNYDDTEAKRRKRRSKKLYRELGEYEI